MGRVWPHCYVLIPPSRRTGGCGYGLGRPLGTDSGQATERSLPSTTEADVQEERCKLGSPPLTPHAFIPCSSCEGLKSSSRGLTAAATTFCAQAPKELP